MTVNGGNASIQIRLRYDDKCRRCAAVLAAGTLAVYDRSSKTVICSECSAGAVAAGVASNGAVVSGALTEPITAEPGATEPQAEPEIFAGVAGASARRENERRSAQREARIRKKHPKIGGFILAMTEDPQSTKAWAVGARGEEKLGRRLDRIKSDTVHLLHDRRIPGSQANIDHIAVGQAGVYVIDAKKYKGKPNLRVEGGLFRERTETLFVGTRNCTKLIAGGQKQVRLVSAALAKAGLQEVPVVGMLCFVEAEWPLLGGDFTTSGIRVLWPGRATDLIRKPGPIEAQDTQEIFRALAKAFPEA